MIVLQERDHQILRIAYEHQFLMTEHVEPYFTGRSYRAVRQRIAELCEANLLQEDPIVKYGRCPVYRLTPYGVSVVLSSGFPRVDQSRRLNLASLMHDSYVISVRQRLEQIWRGTYVCERAIKKKDFREVPDGLFYFPTGKIAAIEVENSDKGRTRFVKLLHRWKSVPSVSFVLYVVTQDRLLETIRRYVEDAPDRLAIGLVPWKELKSNKPKVWSPQGMIPLFDRREL